MLESIKKNTFRVKLVPYFFSFLSNTVPNSTGFLLLHVANFSWWHKTIDLHHSPTLFIDLWENIKNIGVILTLTNLFTSCALDICQWLIIDFLAEESQEDNEWYHWLHPVLLAKTYNYLIRYYTMLMNHEFFLHASLKNQLLRIQSRHAKDLSPCNLTSQVDVNLDFVQAEQKNIYQMSFNLNLCSLKNYCWIKNHFTNIGSTKGFTCYSFRFSKAPSAHSQLSRNFVKLLFLVPPILLNLNCQLKGDHILNYSNYFLKLSALPNVFALLIFVKTVSTFLGSLQRIGKCALQSKSKKWSSLLNPTDV